MLDNSEIYAELGGESDNINKYINIGNLLKNRRLDMNISVDNMARALKLSSNYIIMVEEGEYDTVSQKIYYFGYIRNLARYLKLDEEIVLRYLIVEIKIDEKSLKNHIDNADKNILSRSIMSTGANSYKKNNYNSIYLVVFSIITLLSFGLLIKYQSNINSDPITFSSVKQNIKL